MTEEVVDGEKWRPVVRLLEHMVKDEDLMLQWGLIQSGDVRSRHGRIGIQVAKRADLGALIQAVQARVDGVEVT